MPGRPRGQNFAHFARARHPWFQAIFTGLDARETYWNFILHNFMTTRFFLDSYDF